MSELINILAVVGAAFLAIIGIWLIVIILRGIYNHFHEDDTFAEMQFRDDMRMYVNAIINDISLLQKANYEYTKLICRAITEVNKQIAELKEKGNDDDKT